MTPGTVILFAILLGALALLVAGARPANDPGPWRYDIRVSRPGKCRYRSLESSQMCRRDEGHRWRHDGLELVDDVLGRQLEHEAARH